MDFGIAGKWALVCAASKGLGKGCALALAKEGANVVITSAANTPITITAVPEASTWAMMLSGLAVAGAIARRRKPD